jgi:hypothetical protein
VVLAAVLVVAACWALAVARPVPVATGDPGLASQLARVLNAVQVAELLAA